MQIALPPVCVQRKLDLVDRGITWSLFDTERQPLFALRCFDLVAMCPRSAAAVYKLHMIQCDIYIRVQETMVEPQMGDKIGLVDYEHFLVHLTNSTNALITR